MKTKTTNHKNDCLPFDIPPFTRNNYFTGKLLTERDFTAEQHYGINKLRLHHIGSHGWGVVCGLKVKPHPFCPELRVVVEPGRLSMLVDMRFAFLGKWSSICQRPCLRPL